MRESWKRFVAWVSHSVTLPDDSESIRIRKTTVAVIFIVIVPVNFIWTFSLFSLGLKLAALINLTQGLMTTLGNVYLFRTRNFFKFGHMMMFLVLLYIYSLQSSLGGIIDSGGLIICGLLAVMGSALVASRRSAIFWAGVNVAGMTFSLAFEDRFAAATAAALPENFSLINGFFNAAWMTTLGMFLILYLVRELETAQDLADGLLYNVLPPAIAARLKRDEGTIADSYESASVLFADIVGFTPLSTVLSPDGMIALLNEIYSHFDALVETHGVEKLRTIGDNYMVASGVPEPRPDHAQALADLALDMQAYCRQIEPVGGHRIRFRIGINSGPLIAGVIGTSRFQYDIWGDTVNTASRMESHGEPGKIQVTAETQALLGERYALVPRGPIEVKGKGELETWYLVGRTASEGVR